MTPALPSAAVVEVARSAGEVACKAQQAADPICLSPTMQDADAGQSLSQPAVCFGVPILIAFVEGWNCSKSHCKEDLRLENRSLNRSQDSPNSCHDL